jgi:DNA polymerase-4
MTGGDTGTRDRAGGKVAPAPANAGRHVLHVDMDAFYASVEAKEDPALRGRPVVVGGTGNRGVVASASYEARAFGVRSAMPGAQARRLCPHAVFLAPHFDLYHAYSEGIHQIFESVTPLVEGVGLDEAFLDVSGCGALFGPPAQVAVLLHRRVTRELGIQCSVGGGPSKLVAKLASRAAKPRASRSGPVPGRSTVVVGEADVLGFIWPMPVEALWGVGPASRDRLHKLGVKTVAELAALPAGTLRSALGKSAGQLLHELAWGRDPRPVVPGRAPKSIGHEETFPVDVVDRQELERRLVLMADAVAGRLRSSSLVARTVTLKLRYGDFTTLSRSHTFPGPQVTGPGLWAAGKALLDALDIGGGVRLLGMSASGLLPAGCSPGEQLQLALGADVVASAGEPVALAGTLGGTMPSQARRPDWVKASAAVDAVRARFGQGAVQPAVSVARGRAAHGTTHATAGENR